jgi:flagellar motor switch protein FliN/FliY
MRVSGETGVTTINEVSCDISVVLGSTIMPIHQMLRMGRGAIIELDATEDDEVTILANNMPVAKGTVSINGNRIGVTVTGLLARPETAPRI